MANTGADEIQVHERRYPDVAALMAALAGDTVADLRSALDAGREASLGVSGGNTPIPLFERLAAAALDWGRVWITLGDERWVNPASADSNEKLVRDHLLQQRARAARFVGLWNGAADAHAGAGASWSALAAVPRPFDRLILGMGDDGHTASLFPGLPVLATALDPAQPPGCVATQAPTSPHARLSLNLAALLQARRISLLLAGKAKWNTYERARENGPAADMPIRAVLRQRSVPVTVYWAP